MVRCLCVPFLALVLPLRAANLTVYPEHQRPDPFGAVVAPDRVTGDPPARQEWRVVSARAAWVSCHVVASVPEGGEYRLEIEPFPRSGGIEAELFREWFHFVPADKRYYPDALIPVKTPYASRMPEPDNKVAGQTAQAFWLDLWIPESAEPGSYRARVILRSGAGVRALPLIVDVLAARVPPSDAVTIDHNTYGTSWLAEQYPSLRASLGDRFYSSDEFFHLIHSYHRIFYEHRGVFHQLGYGHAGKVGPEFAPRLEGSGKSKHIADWGLYDRHYGPLFDGSAFAGTRRGARPVPFVYLPVNPEWPASLLWWGEAGYEREFVNVVSEMERHFRQKGWTQTRFELFFNHKKRYKGFSWDGDEARFSGDYRYLREYARLLKAAVPPDSPVKFVYRADVSWTMERQFTELAGVIDLWVCGGGMFGWYRDWAPKLKARGDIVWIYGGTPVVGRPASHITTEVLRTWILGADGFVRWLTTSPGPDPWFQFQGGAETLVYSGDRFGAAEPMASVRLKIERNAVQDLTLLDSFRARRGIEQLRAEAARRFNQTAVSEWAAPRPELADTNPEDWSNATIDDAIPKDPKFDSGLDAAAWRRVRALALEFAREAR